MADLNIEHDSKAAFEQMNSRAGTILHMWQDNTARMMRANERAIHGVLAAARLEIALGQELVSRRIEAMTVIADGGKPADKLQLQMERSLHGMERVMETALEATNELREGFTEAARILFDQAEQQAKEMAAEVQEAAAEMPKAMRKAARYVEEA